MKALGMDLRERIMAITLEGNESMPKIAAHFSVSHNVVQKLKHQWRDLGTLQPQTHKVGRKRSFTQTQSERLNTLIQEDSGTTIWNEAHRLGHTFKKTLHASEATRTVSCT